MLKSTGQAGSRDTFIESGVEYANTSYGSHPWLGVGSVDGGAHIVRSLLYFDLGALPGPDVVVGQAYVSVANWYSSGGCMPARWTCRAWGRCSATPPPGTPNPPSMPPGWCRPPTSRATPPPGRPARQAQSDLDATSLASRWLKDTAPNYGVSLRATNETDTSSYRGFYSADAGALAPQLVHHLHPPADGRHPRRSRRRRGAGRRFPDADGRPATDPDGDPATSTTGSGSAPAPNVVGGNVIDSGWINAATPGYVPCAGGQHLASAGRCRLACSADGVYRWHVFSLRRRLRQLFCTSPPTTTPTAGHFASPCAWDRAARPRPTPSARCRRTWPRAT